MNNGYSFKKIFNMILIGLSITLFILIMIVFLTSDLDEVFDALKNSNIKYFLIALLLMVVYTALYPLTGVILTKKVIKNFSFGKAYLISSTEHFFNGITPFSTGGQPFQAYAYARLGVKPAISTGVLMMNFIIHMIVTNLFAIISLFYYPIYAQNINSLLPLIVIGFAMNFLVLIFIICLATSRKLRDLLVKLLISLSKIKFLTKFITEKRIDGFKQYCVQTQQAFKELYKNPTTFLYCFVIRAITMAVYYSITFLLLKMFHIDVTFSQIFVIMCSTSFAITMCVFIPTPGSSGGIEFAFTSIFTALAVGITPNVATSAMIVWRFLSYYLIMLISFIMYLILEQITKRTELPQSPPSYTESEENNEDPALNEKYTELSEEL